MADTDTMVFDTSMKKKKKSSKEKGDGLVQTEEEKKKLKSKTLQMMNQQQEEEAAEEEAVEEKKERKKKSKSKSTEAVDEEAAEGGDDDLTNVDFGKKKKKKSSSDKSEKSEKSSDKSEKAESEESAPTTEESSTTTTGDGEGGITWLGTDRDYKYTELTYRIYHLLQVNNPDLISDQKRQMKPPQVFREGTKKTVWANFAEICVMLNRKPEHFHQYVFAELGTTGSVDGNNRLVIRGRFNNSQIEVVIRHYIAEYVACRNCKSPSTILERKNRLYFLCCNACNSKRSVAVIKKGLEVGKKAVKEGN
eukprot:gene4722-5896_t